MRRGAKAEFMTMANPQMVPVGFSHWASDFIAVEAFDANAK